LKSKSVFSVAIFCLFIITASNFPIPTEAQTNPVTVATGFQLNLFADPTNIPEFRGSGVPATFIGPSALAFDKRGRLFVSTLSGKILILLDNNDDGRADEVKTFATGVPTPLGMTFRANGDLFVTSNQLPFLGGLGRITRIRDINGDDIADEQTIILDGLPSTGDHQTDRVRFGPDGLLYFGQGSATDNGVPKPGRPAEQPLNATMLRINVDVPNPTPEVFATGLRNPFGMAFHPVNGELFSTDGGSGEICQFGNCGEDLSPLEEVNWIVQGGNYGFPSCEGTPDSREGCAGVRVPIQQFSPHLTPTSLAFYTGPQAGEFTNHLLVTVFKRYRGEGGNLQKLIIEGDKTTGFRVTGRQEIAEFGLIDPGDGPVDTAIDPISGDIYVARTDTVPHADQNEHHHFIYRIHRQGSDALPFIGVTSPSFILKGSGPLALNLVGRHLKPGAVVLADGAALTTRQGASLFDLIADLPASLLSNPRTIMIQVRNPDGSLSNQQAFAVTVDDMPPPPPDRDPQISNSFVYFKNRGRVINPLVTAQKGKKYGLVVSGSNFGTGAQLLVNGTALEIVSSSASELEGKFTNPMLRQPGVLNIQVRTSDNKTSNIVTIPIAAQ
jgi:glucose/arabinose dehydrogenase